MKEAPLALTFADVSLVPRRSRVTSRALVDTTSLFSRSITLQTPIVSANMDSITMSPMAIALAQLGGIGVIHRFLSPADEAREVARVKRASHYRVDRPYTIAPSQTISEARALVEAKGVSGLLVVKDSRLVGIITSRDMRAASSDQETVVALMTPRESLLVAQENDDIEVARARMLQARVEKLPVVDDDDNIVGLYTLRDIDLRSRFPLATRDASGRLRVAAAIGVRGDYIERAQELVAAGVDALVLDIAHGHADHALAAAKRVKETFPDVDLVAGNIATAQAVGDLVLAGVDAVKAGLGNGAACTTRLVAGVGVPQWTAVSRCAAAAHDYDVPMIADGGVREPGDVAKAIGAGASCVMVGGLFAGCDEAPGEIVRKNGRKLKVYRGMASSGAAATRLALEGNSDALTDYVAEGTEFEVEPRGPVAEIVQALIGGLRSGMSYSDSLNIPEFWEKAEFISQTSGGRRESEPLRGDWG